MRGCLFLTAVVCGSCLLGSAELLRDPYKVGTSHASALAVLILQSERICIVCL